MYLLVGVSSTLSVCKRILAASTHTGPQLDVEQHTNPSSQIPSGQDAVVFTLHTASTSVSHDSKFIYNK